MSDATPRLELIAAVARNGVIGRDGQLPWRLPDDLAHFKRLTMGHAVIMGRMTFESIGRPLPGRRSIVVSRTLPATTGIEVASSLDDALTLAADSPQPSFVIGGAALYGAALPRAYAVHLTELDDAVEGDTFFPSFDRSSWRLAAEIPHPRDDRHAHAFRFCTYERVASAGV
jgi:dihydrofolate reductase